tara:strand:- start:297 stop:542 length:246 start_codon:yes stop_codon:yes gene_type:complete
MQHIAFCADVRAILPRQLELWLALFTGPVNATKTPLAAEVETKLDWLFIFINGLHWGGAAIVGLRGSPSIALRDHLFSFAS